MAGTLYLGVEGGATLTTGVLVDPDGAEVARRTGGPANLHSVGGEAARDAVAELVCGLLGDAGVGWGGVASSALCMAGLRRESDRERWREIAERVGIPSPLRLTHDAAAALAAGSPSGAGILVICGTGSLVYGRREDGREHRVGGRGPLLGDEGSGFDIGHRALRAAARAADGLGRPTALTAAILRQAGVDGLEDLLDWANPFAKDRVASLAPAVCEAASQGDAVARDIVAGAASSLARAVDAVWRRLWGDAEATPLVVLWGGVLRHQPVLRDALVARLKETRPKTDGQLPEVDGAVGAARVARLWAQGRL